MAWHSRARSREPALLPGSQPCLINYREVFKVGESSLATATVLCRLLMEKKGQRKIHAGKMGVEKRRLRRRTKTQ